MRYSLPWQFIRAAHAFQSPLGLTLDVKDQNQTSCKALTERVFGVSGTVSITIPWKLSFKSYRHPIIAIAKDPDFCLEQQWLLQPANIYMKLLLIAKHSEANNCNSYIGITLRLRNVMFYVTCMLHGELWSACTASQVHMGLRHSWTVIFLWQVVLHYRRLPTLKVPILQHGPPASSRSI